MQHLPNLTSMRASCVAVLSALALAACGGGGGDSTPAASGATSWWMLDSRTYVNGGNSAQSTTPGANPTTVAVMSTATIAGGDTSNGAYSGSSLQISFKGASAGTYTVAPDRETFVNTPASANPIFVEATVGIAVTTGSSVYTASSGAVQVTLDSAGKYHFDTDTVVGLPTARTMDVLGGVVGAPATMRLLIRDAF
jgi:hypothetical protein